MRLLIFDAAKILSVFLIVLHHLPIGINERLGLYNVFIPVIGYPSIGSVGVIVFVITSGALLENKYGAGHTVYHGSIINDS
jgi:peptidoglycan/LPS O-acetylase OafA/YrhL